MSKTLAWSLEFILKALEYVLDGGVMWPDACLGWGESLGWKDNGSKEIEKVVLTMVLGRTISFICLFIPPFNKYKLYARKSTYTVFPRK